MYSVLLLTIFLKTYDVPVQKDIKVFILMNTKMDVIVKYENKLKRNNQIVGHFYNFSCWKHQDLQYRLIIYRAVGEITKVEIKKTKSPKSCLCK